MGAELIKATVINIYKKTLQLPEYPLSWPSELIMRPLGLAPPGAFDPAPRASGPLGLWAPSAPFSYPGGVRPLPSPPWGAEMGAWLTAVTPGEPVTVTWRVLGAQLVDRLRRLSLTKGSWRKNRNRVVNKRKPDSGGRGSFLSWPRQAPRGSTCGLRPSPSPAPGCTCALLLLRKWGVGWEEPALKRWLAEPSVCPQVPLRGRVGPGGGGGALRVAGGEAVTPESQGGTPGARGHFMGCHGGK